MTKHKRHGDVILHPIEKIKGEKQNHNGTFVLAIGKATGHSHQILCEQMQIFRKDDRTFLELENAELLHQQHKPLKLTGNYVQVQERELDNFTSAVRKVVD